MCVWVVGMEWSVRGLWGRGGCPWSYHGDDGWMSVLRRKMEGGRDRGEV
jgi:hypothetical protein